MRRPLRSGRRGATRSTGWKAEPDTREGRSIKTYQFNVNSQCIGTSKLNAFVSGSAEIYEAVFSFDASWEGFARTAVFECRGERREQLLVNDRCIVPWEILHAGAFLRVGVYGVDGNKTMPTVYSGQMFIARGAEPSEAAREHSADMFDQIVEIGQQAAEAKEQWENMSAEAETLPAGAEATASYADGVLHLGIPGGATHPYLSLSRLGPYLFDVSFADVPEDNGAAEALGSCSSYVKDGKLYRNLDWEYSNLASFRVRCSGFEGMAFLPGLTDSGLSDELIGQLPYHLTDGVNSHGIMVAEHVLFNDWDWHGTGNIPLTKLPYLILTRVRSMATIEADLADILPQLCTTPMQDASEYLLQFIVTDGETTCAILPPVDGGDYEIVDITANAKMTNFRWVADGTVDRADLQLRPTGVERWNMIPAALKSLRFTLAYEAPDRLSEFIGIRGTTKDSTDEELESVYELAAAEYARRERDGETWQTMHSVVYSTDGLESLCVQENWAKDYASGMALPERPAFDSRKKYALCLIPNAAGTDWELAWSEFTPQDPAASSIVGTGKVGYMIIE